MSIKIIHLASFIGNVGDVANHEGFYSQFKKLFMEEPQIEKLEMRMFYSNWRKWDFDDVFVDKINKFDLLVIGGGGFFDLCWDYSVTGTTLNLSSEIFRKIKVPIFINAMGIDVSRNVSSENIEKFRLFLEQLTSRKNVFLTVRNDGSFHAVQEFFPEFSNSIIKLPDHGFFLNEIEEIRNYYPVKGVKSIGINIAVDLNSLRYSSMSYNTFKKKISELIEDFLSNTDYNIYFIAHIQSDYKAFVEIMENIDEKYLRTRISLTPLIQGQELETFKYYKECEIIFGMRFHTNVCAISLGIPTLGLVTHPKPEFMYHEIGLPQRSINITDPLFFEKFKVELDKIVYDKEYLPSLKMEYEKQLEIIYGEKEAAYVSLIQWLKEQGLL